MSLAVLSIDLTARLAGLQDGMDRAARLSQKTAADIDSHFKRLNDIGTKLGSVIGAAFSADVLRQFISATIDGVDALNDVADATGATVENISALDDIARRTGTTLDVVESVLVKFNAGLNSVDGKNGTSQALKAIGLDAEALKKIDPAEALRQTAVALAGFADNGNKARLIQVLFGKSVKEAAPFLKDLAEQTGLYGTVTKQASERAEQFNKNIAAIQATITGFARSLLGFGDDSVTEQINSTGKALEFLQKKLASGKATEDTIKRIEVLTTKLRGLQKQLDFPGAASDSRPSAKDVGNGTGTGPAAVPEIPFATKDAKEYYRELFLLSEKSAYDIVEVQKEAYGSATTDATEYYKELFLKSEKSAYDIEQVVESSWTRQEAFAAEAGESIRAEIGASLVDALHGDFDNIEKAWGDLLLRLVARAIETNLADYLIGKDNKSGVIGGFIASLFASANGNAFGPGGVIPFANGGVVSGATVFGFGGGRMGVMGEAGPEAILPLSRGPDGKLGVKGNGGGVTIINNVAAGPTRNEVLTALQQVQNASNAYTDQQFRKLGLK